MKKNYVIFGGIDEVDNQPMFWNNNDGWVTLDDATKFSAKEKRKFLDTVVVLNYNVKYNSVWVKL